MSATAASAATRIGATLISAACFTWVALFNGYPLVFSDTGAYLFAGIEHYILNDRPIFYGIFMIPLHLNGWSLWPVTIAQCLILAYVLRLSLRVLNVFSETAYLAVSVFLAAFSTAPWFTAFIMPDLFASISMLSMFILFFGWEKLSPLERCLIAALALTALGSHISHLAIGLGLGAVFLLFGSLGQRRRKAAWITVSLLPLLALSTVVGVNVVAKGRAVIALDSYVFLFARFFVDGPAYEYMHHGCTEQRWSLCRIYESRPSHTDILWNGKTSVWAGSAPPEQVRAEAESIVQGTILSNPRGVIASTFHNVAAQLMTFEVATDIIGWCCADTAVARAIQRYFPQEFAPFIHAAQQEGSLDATHLNQLYLVVLVVSLLGTTISIILTRSKILSSLAAVIATGFLFNAFVTGAISDVQPRYQARIIWLVPLLFAVSLLVLLAPLSRKIGYVRSKQAACDLFRERISLQEKVSVPD